MAGEVATRVVEREVITPEFAATAAEMLNRAFGGWPRLELTVSPAEHLAWKVDGPLPGFPAALVAEVDGRLAGYRTVLARRVRVEGTSRLFLHFVDAAVDPEYQGRGVYRLIQDLMQEQFHPLFDLSIDDGTNATIVRGRNRLGTTRAFGNTVRPYLLPLDAMRLIESRPAGRVPPSLMALAVSAASRASRLAPRRVPALDAGVAVRTVARFDERFDAFCADATAPFDFVAERDAGFLNWRYADPRAGRYTIRVAERDGHLLGYAVSKPGAVATSIADLLVAPGELAVAVALVRDAVALARDGGSAAVSCWMPERHPYQPALRGAGFVSLRRSTSLVYRAVSMPGEGLAFLERSDARMHLTHGDTDFI